MHPFNLNGENFDEIPNDAVAVVATNNEEPLQFRYSTSAGNVMHVAQKTNTAMLIQYDELQTTGNAVYLGAILSRDRSTIYWVNKTKPLP